MNTNDELYLSFEVCFWANSGIPLCQTWVCVHWRQSLTPHCARSSCSGRQLLGWDWKYEFMHIPTGKRWQKVWLYSYHGMEHVNYSNYSWKALQCNFSSGHINRKIITLFTIMKIQIVIVLRSIVSRQNIHFESYFATSQTWLAVLITCQVWTAWLSQLTTTSVNGSVW